MHRKKLYTLIERLVKKVKCSILLKLRLTPRGVKTALFQHLNSLNKNNHSILVILFLISSRFFVAVNLIRLYFFASNLASFLGNTIFPNSVFLSSSIGAIS